MLRDRQLRKISCDRVSHSRHKRNFQGKKTQSKGQVNVFVCCMHVLWVYAHTFGGFWACSVPILLPIWLGYFNLQFAAMSPSIRRTLSAPFWIQQQARVLIHMKSQRLHSWVDLMWVNRHSWTRFSVPKDSSKRASILAGQKEWVNEDCCLYCMHKRSELVKIAICVAWAKGVS